MTPALTGSLVILAIRRSLDVHKLGRIHSNSFKFRTFELQRLNLIVELGRIRIL